MMGILYVDGYNMIGAWPPLQTLFAAGEIALAREELVQMLGEFGKMRDLQIVVVFDAGGAPGGEHRELLNSVTIVYTAHGETADTWIERAVSAHLEPKRARKTKAIPLDRRTPDHKIYVATSDREEQTFVLGRGALRISARELWEEIIEMRKEASLALDRLMHTDSRTPLECHLPDDIREYFQKYRRK